MYTEQKMISQQTQNMCTTCVQRRPMLVQHCTNVILMFYLYWDVLCYSQYVVCQGEKTKFDRFFYPNIRGAKR